MEEEEVVVRPPPDDEFFGDQGGAYLRSHLEHGDHGEFHTGYDHAGVELDVWGMERTMSATLEELLERAAAEVAAEREHSGECVIGESVVVELGGTEVEAASSLDASVVDLEESGEC